MKLKKQFLYAENFAKASLNDIFTEQKLKSSLLLTADYFQNAIFINNGNLSFEAKALPWQSQLSPLKNAIIIDANGDNLPDILTGGNFYDNNIEMGRYDADYGMLLINQGNNKFSCSQLNGVVEKGQTRHIKEILVNNKPAYILAKNNDSSRIIEFYKQPILKK